MSARERPEFATFRLRVLALHLGDDTVSHWGHASVASCAGGAGDPGAGLGRTCGGPRGGGMGAQCAPERSVLPRCPCQRRARLPVRTPATAVALSSPSPQDFARSSPPPQWITWLMKFRCELPANLPRLGSQPGGGRARRDRAAMYNGIGLTTPRGSGTNGYVQKYAAEHLRMCD